MCLSIRMASVWRSNRRSGCHQFSGRPPGVGATLLPGRAELGGERLQVRSVSFCGVTNQFGLARVMACPNQ